MTDAQVTQITAEHWGSGTPDGQATQIGVEQWTDAATLTVMALTTQVAVEQWAKYVAPVSSTQARVWILA